MRRFLCPVLLLLIVPVSANVGAVDFVRDVQPIFKKKCYACHGEDKQKSGLRLDIRSQAFRGGDGYGASIVPARPGDSPLMHAVLGTNDVERMPPKGDGLSAQEIKTRKDWIADGAVWPQGADVAKVEDRRDHWSFKPVQKRVAPEVGDRRWARNAIDRFILAALEEKGLRPWT